MLEVSCRPEISWGLSGRFKHGQ